MQKIIPITFAFLLLAGPAQALLQPEPSRFDLDNQQPGALIERVLTIRNEADTPTWFELEVVRFQQEGVIISPSHLQLEPGASGQIHVIIQLADDAAGGRHDLRIIAKEGEAHSADGVGARSAVRMPIVFHVENLKVASLKVDDVLPGSQGNATAMVFNHLGFDANVTLHVLVRDHAGREALRTQSVAQGIAAQRHRFLSVPLGTLPGGEYSVQAWAEHAAGRSNTMLDAFAVGAKRATIAPVQVEPLGEGMYRLSADFANVGTVGLELHSSFRIESPSGLQEIEGPSYLVDAAQSVVGSITVRLDPGLTEIVAVASWDGGEASSPATTYQASDDVPAASQQAAWPYIVGGASMVAGLAIALVRRRGLP